MGSKGLTLLAYDDDTKGTIGSKDVTLAYDDDTKGPIGFKDVTLSYDDFRYKKCLQERIN